TAGDAGVGPRDLAADKRKAVGVGRGARLSDLGSAGECADLAVCEEGGAATPNEVGIALDERVADIDEIAAVVVEHRILIARQFRVEDNDAFAVGAEGLGLRAALGCAVSDREIDERVVVPLGAEAWAQR